MTDADEFQRVRELAGDCIELLVSVGLIDSISDRWPDQVLEQWHERLYSIKATVNRMTEEVQEFGSAWDEPDADADAAK